MLSVSYRIMNKEREKEREKKGIEQDPLLRDYLDSLYPNSAVTATCEV